jgi:predicted Rossmann fold flavoprotein
VLDALFRAAQKARVQLVHPWRVGEVRRDGDDFVVMRASVASSDGAPVAAGDSGPEVIRSRRLILAAGGMALPRSGSDGKAYQFIKSLGHSVTPVFPALVPLVLGEAGAWIKELSGLTLNTTLELHSATGKKLIAFTNSTLCTHFGLSGPSVLDISRYYTEAKRTDPCAKLTINWVPALTFDAADAWLSLPSKLGISKRLSEKLPDRLARAICASVGIEPGTLAGNLKRDDRRAIARRVVATELPINGDRGFTYAEVTAGGVPLSELHLDTMESRVCPGLHLCGEICDVDGRIGGFNFQWAWASGHAAGVAAARAIIESATSGHD